MFIWLVVAGVLAESIALPDGPPVGMDYLAYDAKESRVWVPAGNTGNVDVVGVANGKVTITVLRGFATKPSSRADRPRMGPSSVTIADAVVWVGNRADDGLCSFEAKTLHKLACVAITSMPDGLAYVAKTSEIWVTTPQDRRITIVAARAARAGAAAPTIPQTIPLDGEPEGYAVDQAKGIFYTNLEDKDRTLAIDVETRKVLAVWSPGCGPKGPRGLALDARLGQLFVACTDGVVALDVAHSGGALGRIRIGGGVDNIDYDARTRLLYVASGSDGKLTFARLNEHRALAVVGERTTAAGARNAVIDASGTAYVPDSAGGRLIVVRSPPH
jgi:DNA-binding beta-propeller fold protein YncE